MIPKKEEKRKTLVEAFIEGLPVKDYERRETFLRAVDAFFKSILDSVQSHEEWHEQMSSLNVVLVKGAERKPGRILPSYLANRWCDIPGEKFLAIRNPAELDDDELMLVPEKTIEKMIALGALKCTSR